MPRLVTGLFYAREDADRAVEALREQGVPADDIYVEAEVAPPGDMGRKGGEISSAERERRIAGLETGVIIGLTVGVLAGMGIGILGGSIQEMMRATDPAYRLTGTLANPTMTAVLGGLLGLLTGGLIGWVVDFTLNRIGAGPPLPRQETLVTVRTAEDRLDQVYAILFRVGARHLHLAERATA